MKPRPYLWLSLSLNVVLGGFLAHRAIHETAAPAVPNSATLDAAQGRPKMAAASTKTAPFRWSQLEASDYPTYIANLRAIGCPEQTIRDIITADVASMYDAKRETAGNADSNSKKDKTALPVSDRLRQEEQAVLAQLLPPTTDNAPGASADQLNPTIGQVNSGSTGGPGWRGLARSATPAGSSSAAVAVSSQQPAATGQPATGASPATTTPLVLVDPGSDMKLSDQGWKAFQQLAFNFSDSVGGTGQNPADPAYAQRWEDAQPKSDEMFELWFGADAYMAQQLKEHVSGEKAAAH